MKKISLAKFLIFMINFCLTISNSTAQTFEWARQYGGTGDEVSRSVATDIAGNVYITGYSDSVYYDFFISKLDSNGNFIWTKLIGGPYVDFAEHITIDNACNIYVCGSFTDSVDFDPGPGVTQLKSEGLWVGVWDAFLLKIDSAGNFSWVKQFGGLRDDRLFATCIDNSNAIYFCGTFFDTAYVSTVSGITQLISNGIDDAIIGKTDSAGNVLWVKSFGGTSFDYPVSIAIDNNSDLLFTGSFRNLCDFNPDSISVNSLQSFGLENVFVCKWDTSANFIWVKQIGGTSGSYGTSIATDALNNVFVGGYFHDTIDADPDINSYNLISNGWNDAFVVKLNDNGTFLWGKSWGSTSYDFCFSLSVDILGNVYSTGKFTDTVDFDAGSGNPALIASSVGNTFISKINNNGSLLWVEQLWSSGSNIGFGIALDATQNIYVTGNFSDTCDFNPSNQFYGLIADGIDAYILKWSQTGTAIVELTDKTDLMVFPNPFSDKLFLGINQPSLISIKNTMGQIIYEKKLHDGVTAIDLSELENGAYFIGVQSANNYLNRTIIKTN